MGLPGLLAQVPSEQALLLGLSADSTSDTASSLSAGPPAGRRRRGRGRRGRCIRCTGPAWLARAARHRGRRTGRGHDRDGTQPTQSHIPPHREDWGTRIDANCSYAHNSADFGAQPYALFVTDRAGRETIVAGWIFGPGTTISAAGTTTVAENDIARVDIRWMPDERVLLKSRPSW
ncbi:hypothetical protein IWX77_001645 [Cryobacterium sp. CAN_C2]